MSAKVKTRSVLILILICITAFILLLSGCSAKSGADNKYGVYYEIFVRSFADSNNDGIGDIKGLTSRLDYLNDNNPETDTDLGINGIYLMPVNAAESYHKYDVTDYYDIDPEYGTMEDFTIFLEEAHKRGIKVIMDLVVNHTSSKNQWFIESARSEDNPFRDYYTWISEGQEGYNVKAASSWGGKVWHRKGGSYYYGIFWDQMPDLNFENPKVRREIKKIEKFWLKKGVDGFRLDAGMHIYGANESPTGTNYLEKNIGWWKEFAEAGSRVNPNTYLIAEVWDKAYAVAPYYESLDSLFNFEVGEGIFSIINTGVNTAVASKGFSKWLEEKYEIFAKADPDFLDAPFLSNHDQNRSMDRLRGDTGKAKLAAAVYMTLPGNPFIYYGEEIGMTGTKPDERIREPFIWFEEAKPSQCCWETIENNRETVPEEVQQMDPDSLLNYYKKLIKLRQSSEALMMGDFKALDAGSKAVVAYSRSYAADGYDKATKSGKQGGNVNSNGSGSASAKEYVIVLHNIGNEKQIVKLENEDLSNTEIIFESSGTGKTAADGMEIEILPGATVVLRK